MLNFLNKNRQFLKGLLLILIISTQLSSVLSLAADVKDIPIGYLMGGIIQKTIIGMNKPELLKIPFTYYDFRHRGRSKNKNLCRRKRWECCYG